MGNDLLAVVYVIPGSFTGVFWERLMQGTVRNQKSAWKNALKLLKQGNS